MGKMGYGMKKSGRSSGKGGGQDKGVKLGSGQKYGVTNGFGSGQKAEAAGSSKVQIKNGVQR